jgi:hypothetical protein
VYDLLPCKLVTHRLDGDTYRVVATLVSQGGARIPPFEEVTLDLGYILDGVPGSG